MFHCHNWEKELFNQFSQIPDDTNGEDIVTIVKNIFKSLQTMPTEEREKLLEELKTDKSRIIEKLKYPKVSDRDELVGLFRKAVKSGSYLIRSYHWGLKMASAQSLVKTIYVFESYSWDTLSSYGF